VSNWKVVTGDDGKEYFEIDAQIVVPDTMSNADGVVMMVAPDVPPGVMYAMDSGQGGYNIEQLSTLRNQMWDMRWPEPYFPSVMVNRWLPGDPEPEPQHPAGRFQNLDWEEAS
jgi:hypothetical protein